MEQINNDQTIKECSDVLGHQVENIPQLDTSKIVLVANVNPKDLRRVVITKTANTSATTSTVYTTPSDRDFYLTNASLSVIKDTTSTSINSQLKVTIDGVLQSLLLIPGITLTAQSETMTHNFFNPIKLDRGSIIQIANNTNVANILASACIQGYLV